MLFNSTEFLVFFPIVVGLYFATPHRIRWAVLLAASYVFYGWWRVEYLTLIIFSTLVDYAAGRRMGRLETRAARRPWLVLSLLSNLGLLFTFKYLGFFTETANALASFVGTDGRLNVPALLLPIGISFYTFQTLAYSIDVYRGVQEPERHLGIFALYVSFWPQLVAGPIERSYTLLPQFRRRHRFEYDRAVSGLRLVLWGFFLKIVLADRLAIAVTEVFNNPEAYGGASVVVATLFFAFQIYGDFAGYSLIAIGCARVMGFELTQNFRTPYFSQSMREFWARWHISLSTWFRDYLYIPLGGNRVGAFRWYVNVFTVFLLSGLWHGASWTYVIWGALHGFYLAFGAATRRQRDRLWAIVFRSDTDSQSRSGQRAALGTTNPHSLRTWWRAGFTFSLVLFAWIFFRADSVGDAVTLVSGVTGGDPGRGGLAQLVKSLGLYDVIVSVMAVFTVVVADALTGDGDVDRWLRGRSTVVRWLIYVALVMTLAIFGVFGKNAFIYFQF